MVRSRHFTWQSEDEGLDELEVGTKDGINDFEKDAMCLHVRAGYGFEEGDEEGRLQALEFYRPG